MFAPVDLHQLLDEMDAHGVQKAILMDNIAKPHVTARSFAQARPDRFALAMGGLNLLRPMPTLRELTRRRRRPAGGVRRCRTELLGRRPVPAERCRLLPAVHQVRRDRPAAVPQHRPARTPIPGEVQNPIHLDRVCVRFPSCGCA